MSAGQLVRFAILEIDELHEFQHFIHALVDFRFCDTFFVQAISNVLCHVHMRKNRIRLKHHVDRSVIRRLLSDVYAVDLNGARRRHFETGQYSEQGRLAAARSAKNGKQFALTNLEVDPVNSNEVAKMFADALYVNEVLHRPLFTRAKARVRTRSCFGPADLIGYRRPHVSSSGNIAGLSRIRDSMYSHDARLALA